VWWTLCRVGRTARMQQHYVTADSSRQGCVLQVLQIVAKHWIPGNASYLRRFNPAELIHCWRDGKQ